MSTNKPFAFQAGDKFWLKRAKVVKGISGPKGGAPLAFASPDVLLKACYEYFEYEHARTWSKPEAIKGGEFAGQLVNVTVKTPFSIEGCCIFIGVNTKYFNDFEDRVKKDKARIGALSPLEVTKEDDDRLVLNNEFSEVITHVKEVINKQKIEGALIGAFHATLASQLAGLATKTETALTGKDGGPVEHNHKLSIDILSTSTGISATEKEIQQAVNEELGIDENE